MSGIMSMVLGAKTAIAAAVDAYFNLVTLLLPGDGTNGAQNNTFIDSSTNNFTITRNGNTTQGTFSPFSQTGWSNYFDGSSAYLTLADNVAFEPGTGDFTIEAWVYDTVAAGTLNVYIAHASSGISFYRNASGKLEFAQDAVAALATSTNNIPVNSWNHIVASRSGTSLKLFINGVQEASVTNSTNLAGTGSLGIGASSNGSNKTTGYISNLRLVKGTAVYTAAFTPPTAPLTAITNTSLLTCQSNRFVDNSSNAFAITVNGTPSIQAFSPFAPTAAYSAATNGGSGYFDGTGDYLSYSPSTSNQFGTGDFTVECWYYPLSTPTGTASAYLIDARTSTVTGTWAFGCRVNGSGTGNLLGWYNGSAVYEPSTTSPLTLNAWNHCVYVRSGTTGALFLNGVRLGTQTDSTNYSTSGATSVIGARYTGDNNINGYMCGGRLVKGTAVYSTASSTLTVPTAPPTAITNTSLLLNFTNAGITDATAKNDLETVGNAQISTTQSKFGGSSMYFDGTGDRLTTRFVPPQDLSGGNWTIEFWMNLGASVPTTFRSIAGASNGGGSVPKWILILNANSSYTYQANRLMFATYNGADRQLNIGFTWATNTWYHIAIVCSSGTTSIYIDGVSQGSMAYNIGSGITNGIVIGADGETYSEFTGYIDDFRVTKGYARYTANFTPPTAAFALQ